LNLTSKFGWLVQNYCKLLPKLYFPYDKEEVSDDKFFEVKLPMAQNARVTLGHFHTTTQNIYLITVPYFNA